MKIVFEGPDNVGKSTQISELKENLCTLDKNPYIVIHSSAVKCNTLTTKDFSMKTYEYLISEFLTSNNNLIFDRSHIGEMVYSPLYRDYDGKYVIQIEKKYNVNLYDDIFLITLIDEPVNLINRDDGLSFSTNYDIKKKEIELFERAHDASIIKNKLLVNIAGKPIDDIQNEIFEFIKKRVKND